MFRLVYNAQERQKITIVKRWLLVRNQKKQSQETLRKIT